MAAVQGMEVKDETRRWSSQAICGNYIMRAGKHWATFSSSSSSSIGWGQSVGVIRPLPGWETRGLDEFSPANRDLYADLLRKRTDRWDGNVQYCCIYMRDGSCFWCNWDERANAARWEGEDDYDRHCATLGMMLDLGEGTLSVYQNGRRVGTLKDGLAGEYCWIAGFWGKGEVSIQRGYNLNTS